MFTLSNLDFCEGDFWLPLYAPYIRTTYVVLTTAGATQTVQSGALGSYGRVGKVSKVKDTHRIEDKRAKGQKGKKDTTPRCSRVVPHPSTERAQRLLTSEFGWDPVH